MKVSYLAGMNVSASALMAQRKAMNAVAENLANLETTKTETGDPYRRQVVTLASDVTTHEVMEAGTPSGLALEATDPGHLEAHPAPGRRGVESIGVTAQVGQDMSDFPTVYDPGHPDADANGMVRMPNVDMAHEMVSLLAASRAYEANIAALQTARKLAEAGLNLAR